MKVILNHLFIVVFLCSAFAKADTAPSYDKECIYVAAKNGLNMRDAAGPMGNVIEKLPYGTKLDWTPPGTKDIKTYVMDNGKKVEGYWVKVWKSVPYQDLKDNTGGYVFSAYLKYHLKEIPSSSLYLFNHFSLQNRIAGDYFDASYDIDRDTFNYSAYIDCYPWYEEHYEEITAHKNDAEKYYSIPADTLKRYIKLEIVDYKDVISQRKETAFDLDYSFQPELLALDDDHNEFDFLKRYYLPLKNKDSVEVKAHTGEFPHNVEYIGEVKKQNKYLIAANFEGLEYAWIDQFTGERIPVMTPLISPDNSYGISHDTVYYEPGAQIGINYFDNKLQAYQSLHINFQSWVVSTSISDSFWVTNNAIVLKVYPIDNTIQEVEMDQPIQPHWQYLKLTIL